MDRESRIARAGAILRARSNPGPPTAAEGDPSATPRLSDDPADIDRWREASHDALLDLFAAGEDAARRQKHRVLSRAEARRRLRQAYWALHGLLDVGAASLRKAG